MQDFRNLEVWKKAHAVVLDVHRSTRSLPRDEIFGVTMHLRRASLGIASRIAEGCGREVDAEFVVDLRKALAGCNELEYLIVVAKDLELWKPELCGELTSRVIEVRRMIHGFIRKL